METTGSQQRPEMISGVYLAGGERVLGWFKEGTTDQWANCLLGQAWQSALSSARIKNHIGPILSGHRRKIRRDR